MLDTFGMQRGETQYRRLVAAFQRVFGAIIFFGTDDQRQRATVIHRARFSFKSEAETPIKRPCPAHFRMRWFPARNSFKKFMDYPISTDMEASRALSCSSAALDLFTWLSYRCFIAKGRERVPLFGAVGIVNQLGSAEYVRPRKFRERLERWLDLVRTLWPACPARTDSDGTSLCLLPSGCHLVSHLAIIRITSRLCHIVHTLP